MAAFRRRSFLGGAQICPVPTGVPSLVGLHSEHTRDEKNRYGPGTLLAKWLEERNGLDEIQKMKPLASQVVTCGVEQRCLFPLQHTAFPKDIVQGVVQERFEHAYRTIYMDSYGKPEIKRRSTILGSRTYHCKNISQKHSVDFLWCPMCLHWHHDNVGSCQIAGRELSRQVRWNERFVVRKYAANGTACSELIPKAAPVFKREPHVFPGHQPELNPPHTKVVPKTTYMLDYVDPVLQMNPLPQSQPNTVEKKQLEYCGPPVPPDMDTDAEKHQLCVSYIPLEPCSPTDMAAVKGRQSEDLRFCGSYIPTEGPLGQCTAELCEPCTPVVVPSRPGLAARCGPIIP